MATDIETAACVLNQAQENFDKAWHIHWEEDVIPLDEGKFWEILDHFINILVDEHDKTKLDAIERATMELARRAWTGQYWKGCNIVVNAFDLDDVIDFTKRWDDYKERLFHILFDVVKDRGDDSYGDFIDALPLAGRDIVNKCFDELYVYKALEADIRELELIYDSGLDVDLILHGESYFSSRLKDAIKHYYAKKIKHDFSRDTLGVIEAV
tara:strand:+ start:122 stop:754 length:633 start_codon:yes stop_codon:yes gene_type:complete